MYLKSLEVQGFKSFPDKTVIRFGDDITAIVGPNGSGKSNISDAILWVMGEQSSKTLRGAKMEDVIFGGTQKRGAVGFAEATLILDNSDRALAYDADEVMVTRRYYRSGDSEYYINRQSSRLRDIHEMFMDTGLGREGYSNIGQGRIDEILSLKSGDRREIFEEAAGISKYRHRKEETERKLERTEDNLLRIGDKVSELELQLEPLRVQSEKARKYLELKEELLGVEVAVWLDSLDKLSAAAKKAEEDYTSAAFVLQQAHEDLDALYLLAQEQAQLLQERDAALETARIQVSMQEAAHQQMEGQMAVLQSNVEHNHANILRIRQELSGQQDRDGGLAQQIAQTQARVEQIAGELLIKAADLAAKQNELAAMTAAAQGRTRRFLELRGSQTALTAEVAGCEADVRSLTESREQSELRLQQLQEDIQTGNGRNRDAAIAYDACTNALKQAQEQALSARNTIAGYRLRQSTRAQHRDELAAQVREYSAQLESVRAKTRVYQAMERDYEHYQKSVRYVMQEAERGGLRNIHGPLSRLIRTDDEFTLAIEIALCMSLQNIVVESERDGKAAMDYLHRTGRGRATFLPISVMKGRVLQENGLENCAGFVGIASDLLRFDPKYRGIIEYQLGRTVIAENMDCAIAMARKYNQRFRIVTLDGQVINSGGSMTGGSTNKEAGILSRANELEKLTRQEEKLSRRLSGREEELREAQRSVDEVEFQLTAAQDELRAAEDECLRLQGQQKQYEVLLEALRTAQESAQRELDALLQRQKADDRRLAAQNAKLQVHQSRLAEIRTQLQLLEQEETETAGTINAISADMTALTAASAALEAEKTAAAEHIADLELLRRGLEGDRLQRLKVIETMEQDNLRLEQEMEMLRQRSRENAAQLDAGKLQLQQVLTSRAQAEAAKTKAEREAQEKSKDILNMERACALLEQKKLTASLEEKQIIDKLWDTYELTPHTASEKRAPIESLASGNRRIAELKRKISGLGTPNLGAIEEYARVNERYSYLVQQRDDVLHSKRELETIIRSITQEMTAIFTTEFAKIDQHFSQVFEEMFGGGKGRLILEDPQNPLTCGIEIRVQPPGKQVKTITLLSGGEKAFVAIALYFAILKVRPTPFCMLDEIDAALDDRNVERFAGYLRNLAAKTQFIVITHRRGTMEASDVLYGVTMQEQGISKLLRLDLNQMEEYLGITE